MPNIEFYGLKLGKMREDMHKNPWNKYFAQTVHFWLIVNTIRYTNGKLMTVLYIILHGRINEDQWV